MYMYNGLNFTYKKVRSIQGVIVRIFYIHSLAALKKLRDSTHKQPEYRIYIRIVHI